jgi:hypothetical protein|tara:strand:- start:1608 stop:2105 length:498 start_codon:yes stop_codon:yes gene_type:complete
MAPTAAALSLFGANTVEPGAAGTVFSLFSAPSARSLDAIPVTTDQQICLNATFEKLPQATKQWLLSTEERVEEWQRASKRFPNVGTGLGVSQQLAIHLERDIGFRTECWRSDLKLLASFKEQERMPKLLLCSGEHDSGIHFRSPTSTSSHLHCPQTINPPSDLLC